MTSGEVRAVPADQAQYERVRKLRSLRDRVHANVVQAGQQDLAAVLDELPVAGRARTVRVVVAGETKRGKSTLVNTLVGRPLLSPVGADVTTACWLELSYGDRDEAAVLLADPASLGAPRRVPVELREIERYVALTEITDPVLGVEVRIRAPLLRDIILVDTPGVGGLHAGHSRATLTALRQADALLFVCDATQPILAPEVDFLVEASGRVPTVVIAVTKCDANPGFEVVVAETQARVAQRAALRDVPVFAISATLADRAAGIENDDVSARLTELSGMTRLITTLTRQAVADSDVLQLADAAQVVGSIARICAVRAEESAADVTGDGNRKQVLAAETSRLADLLDDRPRISALVQHHLARLRVEPLDSFDSVVSAVRAQYRSEAERGPAAQLNTLAPRMQADLTAGGVSTLEVATEQTTELMRQLLERVGVGQLLAEIPMRAPSSLDLDLQAPELADQRQATAGLSEASSVFSTLMSLISGSAVALSVLTGPGVIAASIALAACAGWWKVRGESEQQRRTQLRAWVDTAATAAKSRFDQEMNRRILTVEQYIQKTLPELLSGRQQKLAQLHAELTDPSRDGQLARRAAAEKKGELAHVMQVLNQEAETLAVSFLDAKGTP